MGKLEKEIKKLETSMKQSMGLDVSISRKELPTRKEMNDKIDQMGKDLTQPGLKYVGSINIFMYLSSDQATVGGGELATATNFTGNTGLSLQAIRAMLDNAKVDIVKHYTSSNAKPTDGLS